MECNHEYEVLTDSVDVEEIRFSDGNVAFEITGYAIFYCTKCLDIQKKVIE